MSASNPDWEVTFPRKLDEDETTALKKLFRSVFTQGEDETIRDIVDYGFTILSNGKDINVMVQEINSMGMEDCPPPVTDLLGAEALSFYRERFAKEEPPQEDADKAKPIKSSGTNALTMSGALGASRQGGRNKDKKQQQQGNKNKETRKEHDSKKDGGKGRNRNDRNNNRDRNDRNSNRRDDRNNRNNDNNNNNRDDRNNRNRRENQAFDRLTQPGRHGDDRRRDDRGGRGGGRDGGRGGRDGGRGRGGRDRGRGRGRDGGRGPGRDGGRGRDGGGRISGNRRKDDRNFEAPNKRMRPNNEGYDEYHQEGYNQGYDQGWEQQGYSDYPPWQQGGYRGGGGWRGGRSGGRGGRGRGRGEEGSQADGQSNPAEDAAVAANPSPMVAAAYGGRGRGYRGRGRGWRGGYGGRVDVKSMMAAKTWVRPKDGADADKGGDAPAPET